MAKEVDADKIKETNIHVSNDDVSIDETLKFLGDGFEVAITKVLKEWGRKLGEEREAKAHGTEAKANESEA